MTDYGDAEAFYNQVDREVRNLASSRGMVVTLVSRSDDDPRDYTVIYHIQGMYLLFSYAPIGGNVVDWIVRKRLQYRLLGESAVLCDEIAVVYGLHKLEERRLDRTLPLQIRVDAACQILAHVSPEIWQGDDAAIGRFTREWIAAKRREP